MILNIAGNTGFRHIGGYVIAATSTTPQTVVLFAATAEAANNRLVRFIDSGAGTPTGSALVTAANNTLLRGIAMSPHFAAP